MEIGNKQDLSGLAGEAQRLLKGKATPKLEGQDVAMLLAYANQDGRITKEERAFIQSLTDSKNAKKVASADFNPATMDIQDGSFAVKKPGTQPLSLIDEPADAMQVKVDAQQIEAWKADGNVWALLDVLTDSKTPSAQKDLVRLALMSSPEGRWAMSRSSDAPAQVEPAYAILKGGSPEQKAAAWAYLQRVAAQGGEAGKSAAALLEKAATEVPDLEGIKQAALLPQADDVVFAHKQAEFGVRTDELVLRDKSHRVLFSKAPAADRVRQIPELAASFKAQWEKIDKAIVAIDKDILALEGQVKTAASPQKEQLQARVLQLKAERDELAQDRRSLAVMQVNAAVGCSKADHFPGYSVGMLGTARKAFLEQARSGLDAVKGEMEPRAAAQLDQGLSAANSVFQEKLTLSRIVAAERLQMLTGLRTEIAAIAKTIDDEGLIKGAVKKDPAALKRLDALRAEMIAKIEQLAGKSPAGALRQKGGANDICDALLLVADQLGAYEFDQSEGITNFNEQVMAKMYKKAVDAKFKDIQAKGENPKAEVEAALGVSKAVDSSIGEVDLVAAKKAAAQDDILDSWVAETGVTGVELVRDADFLLENPGASTDKWTKDHGKLVDSLTKARDRFVSSLADNWADNLDPAKRKAFADARPAVAVLDLLITREKLFKPDGTVDEAALKKIDEQIDAKMKDPAVKKDSAFKSLSGMVAAARALDDVQAYKKRIVVSSIADAPGADRAAQLKARELAKADPQHAYGVVDLGFKDGQKLGYQIVQYPLQAFSEKKSWAEMPGTNLVQITMYAGGVVEGGKLSIEAPGKHFEAGKTDAAIAKQSLTDTKVESQKSDKQKILEPMGKRAKELVGKQYAEVIKAFESFKTDNGKLVDFIVQQCQGKSTKEIEQFLHDMFGVSAYVSQGGKDSAPIIALAVRDLCQEYAKLAGKKPPDQDGMEKLKKRFAATSDFATLKGGVEPRLKTLQKAAGKVQDMSDLDAAFKLTREFPNIRQQIYRENGFRLDPAKGVPPIESQSEVDALIAKNPPGFTSTAEMVFVQEAEDWGDWETAKEVGETAVIVGGVLAVSLATGGLGSGVAVGVALGSAAAIGGYGIYKAHAALDQVTAEVVAGFKGHESLTAAETGVALAYVSATVQLGMAGVSIIVGGAMQGATPATGKLATVVSKVVGVDAKLVASELALSTLSTVVDPTTWQGSWKDVVVNIVVGGAVTFVGLRAGASLQKAKAPVVKEGSQAHVVFDQAKKKAYLHVDGIDPIEVKPTGVGKDGKTTFEYVDPVTKENVVIEVQVNKAYTEAKPKPAGAAPDPAAPPVKEAPKAAVEKPATAPVDTPPAKPVVDGAKPPAERVYMDVDFMEEAGVKAVPVGEIVKMGDGKHYQVTKYDAMNGVVHLTPAEPKVAPKTGGTPEPVKLTPDEFRTKSNYEGWKPTDQPNVYKKPNGDLVHVTVDKPGFTPQQVAGIEAEIATRKARIAKNPGTPEAAKDQAIVDGLETLLKTGPATELTHSTNSLMWEGLEKSGGRMLSGKKLTEEGIGRKTGEGDAFSGQKGEKSDIFFGYGEEGLGTSMGYYRLAAETEHYNIGRMSDSDLAAEIAKVQTIKDNYPKLRGPDGPDGRLGYDESKVSARLKSLKDEQARRALLPPGLREAPYPMLFGADGNGVAIKHTPTHPNGIRSESLVADQLDLKGHLKQVFVPADKVADAQARLDKIFGPGHGIKVIPFEALEIAVQGIGPTVSAQKFTTDGLKGNEQIQKMWYDLAYAKATGKK